MKPLTLILLSRRSEKVVNGDFSNGSAGWVLGTNWTLSGEAVVSDCTNSASRGITQIASLNVGQPYRVSFDLVANNFSGTAVAIRFQDQSDASKNIVIITPSTPIGRYSASVIAMDANIILTSSAASPAGSITIDNISVR